jgi:aminomethyltransferase
MPRFHSYGPPPRCDDRLVTSSGFGPSLDAPIAMGYVSAPCAQPGTPLYAEVLGKRLRVTVSALPFVTLHYKRR